jgi:gliding motility-associated-like protein
MISFSAFSQNETLNWYFGKNAGINFSSGFAEPITNSQMNTYEGCSSISDSLGNLLFYTNGVNIWNRNHELMLNGTALMGDTSSTQSALIIPQPQNPNIYYLFTSDVINHTDNGNVTKGLRYSVIDMNLDNGFGAVNSQKNILLSDSVSEKLSAILSPDKSFVRIFSHEWGNNIFISWKLTKFGLDALPTKVAAGTPHIQIEPNFVLNGIGQMKCSPKGNKLAVGLLRASIVEIFDLDIFTGNISNPITIDFDFQAVYGIEFSGNESKLYVTADRKIFQIDLSSGNPTTIINSLTEVYTSLFFIASLQLAVDNKIYCALVNSNYLSTINYPDSIFPKCNYQENSFGLDNKMSRRGLPSFIQSNFKTPFFKYQKTCFEDETEFLITDISGIDSVYWDFGDINSGINNFSKILNPKHIFTNSGGFSVKLKTWISGIESEYQRIIIIVKLPEISLGNDTVFCSQDSVLIGVNSNHLNIIWNNLETTDSIWVSLPGKYSLQAQNIYTGCINKDSINIDFDFNPEISLGNDTSFCENTSFMISAFAPNLTYLWNTSSTDSEIFVENPGKYFVTITNPKGCKSTDTLNLEQILIPVFSLGNDTIICENTILQIGVEIENTDYLWNDGTSNSYLLVYQKGIYSLRTENICGFFEDSIFVDTKYCGEIFIPNIFTPQNDGINDVFYIKGIEEGIWELTILNRWGQKIYQTKNYENNWKAENCESGVYFYVLKNYEEKIELKGTVRVVK